MIYLAIDPGVVSGIAWFDPKEGDFWSDELGVLDDVRRCVLDVATDDTVLVVCERFIISARTIQTKIYYDSIWFEGWLRLECPAAVFQTPAQAKKFATDAKLRHLGWYTRTKDGHANDAARHLLVRAAQNREPWVLERLKEML